MTTEIRPELTAPLLAWYRAAARRLPWRETVDPYRIWVSEIMLQQTRVAAVLGYYERFLAAFPTVEALAGAPEERLMKLWEGLGYYSRARNMRRTAELVAARGSFPGTYEELLSLPGIGEYTAAAVASAAFGQKCAAVDGNVLRVVSRLTDCRADVTDASVRRAFRSALEMIMPDAPEERRVFNQAVMELGATVCVPGAPPRCGDCPVRGLCLGHGRGTAAALPVRRKKKERRVEERTVFVLIRDGRTALRRRADSGLLAGLWEFPNVEGQLDEEAAAAQLARWGLTVKGWRARQTARHIFTHVEWRMTGYTVETDGEGKAALHWMDAAALREHAVPSAFARYYTAALEELEAEP